VKRTLLVGGALSALAIGYGFVAWEYGSSEFRFTDEGWFGSDTKYGGADKAGHAVAAHVVTSGVAWIHRRWGASREDAALRGALTAMGVMTVIEIADGPSEEHGFSWQDMALDAAGCLFGYAHARWPAFARVLDLRWEYFPSDEVFGGGGFDPLTGYDASTYVVAANVGALLDVAGIRVPRQVPLDLLDLQVGYRVRGLDEEFGEFHRQVVAGVGLNLANLLRRLGLGRASWPFEYYQPPGIALRFTIDLDA
jgi:hypothetical protein